MLKLIKTPTLVVATQEQPDLSDKQLAALEQRVDAFLSSYIDAGQALKEIKDKRGYIARGYNTFEEYSEVRFGWEWRQAYRQIAGANTALLCEAVVNEKPRAEAVARELGPVMEDEQKAPALIKRVQAGLKKLGKTIGTATAKETREAVQAVTAKANGNGHRANGTHATTESIPAAPVPSGAWALPAWVTDTCPHCAATPESYQHLPDGWWCGSCHQPVLIGVIAITRHACPHCGGSVFGDADFCQSCGRML